MSGRFIFSNSRRRAAACLAAALLIIALVSPGCKKKEDNLSGTWRGVLTIETAHQHEEYQQWVEVIIDDEGRRTEIVHEEHIVWAFSGKAAIQFSFDINAPVYEARVDGEGDAEQSAAFTPTAQCQLTAVQASGFKVDVFGTVDGSVFNLQVVPRSIPVTNITQACQNVRIRVPAYGAALVDILSEIRPVLPYQSGVTTGGSGSVTPGSGFAPLAYIYNLTLTRQ